MAQADQFPADGSFDITGNPTNTQMQDYLQALLGAAKKLPGGQALVTRTLSLAGQITPEEFAIALDTYGAASAQDLEYASQTYMTDGSIISLQAHNVAHVVTVKNRAGGDGEFRTFDGQDFVLDQASGFIWFRRQANYWVEVNRGYLDYNPPGFEHQLITATGAWVVPGGVTAIKVTLVGGGGGGGGGAGTDGNTAGDDGVAGASGGQTTVKRSATVLASASGGTAGQNGAGANGGAGGAGAQNGSNGGLYRGLGACASYSLLGSYGQGGTGGQGGAPTGGNTFNGGGGGGGGCGKFDGAYVPGYVIAVTPGESLTMTIGAGGVGGAGGAGTDANGANGGNGSSGAILVEW